MSNLVFFGGSSEIGSALVKGIKKREVIRKVTTVSRQDLSDKAIDSILVNDYKNLNNDNVIRSINESKIFIIAFGFLEIENSNKLNIELLEKSISINTIDVLRCIKLIIQHATSNSIEIHVTSSILADAIRPSLFSYSISKSILSHGIEFLRNELGDNTRTINLFHWKLSFVPTKLNSGRKKSLVTTTPEKISDISARKFKGGVYYVPAISKHLMRFLSYNPKILKLLDKLN